MKNILFATIFSLFMGCQLSNGDQTTYGKVISVEQFNAEIKESDVQLVDVRTEKEYNSGHIADAQNMDVLQQNEFLESIQNLDKNKPVYIYCRSGNRSQKAAQLMKNAGFKEIIDLKGGYVNWEKHKP